MSKITNILIIVLFVSFVGVIPILADIRIENDLDLKGNSIINLLDPTGLVSTSTATKGYVDTSVSSITELDDLQTVTDRKSTTTQKVGIAILSGNLDPNYGLTVGSSLGIKASGDSYLEQDLTVIGNTGIGIAAGTTYQLEVNGNVGIQDILEIDIGSSQASWGYPRIGNFTGWGATAYPTIGSLGGSAGSLIMLQNPHVPWRTDNAAGTYTGRAGIRAAYNSSGNWWDFGLAGDFFNVYRSGSGEFLRITNTGNVGIGTATISSGAKLDTLGAVYSNKWCDRDWDVCLGPSSDSNWLDVRNKANIAYKGIAASQLYVGDSGTYMQNSSGRLYINEASGVLLSGSLNMADNNILDAGTIEANTLLDPEDGTITISDNVYLSNSGTYLENSGGKMYIRDSNGVLINGRLNVGGSNFVLGTMDGRGNGGSNRALVNGSGNTLHINYNGDFERGVRIDSEVRITGNSIDFINNVRFGMKAVRSYTGTNLLFEHPADLNLELWWVDIGSNGQMRVENDSGGNAYYDVAIIAHHSTYSGGSLGNAIDRIGDGGEKLIASDPGGSAFQVTVSNSNSSGPGFIFDATTYSDNVEGLIIYWW
ncbi:MAG: hypothetical protein KJI71_03710 [Patescibacteria group bacterium]|nr:hypothetical protein [Patescibacteria group bacterium]